MVAQYEVESPSVKWWAREIPAEPGALGRYYRQAREARGLDQEDVAAAIGWSPNTISTYETGRTIPDEETIAALGRFFQFDPEEYDAVVREELRRQHAKAPRKTRGKAVAPKQDEPAFMLGPVTPGLRLLVTAITERDLEDAELAKLAEGVRNLPHMKQSAEDHAARPQRTKQAKQDSA